MKTFVKIMWVLGGVILILAGCMAFFNPVAGMITFETAVSIALLISGLLSVITYIATHKIMLGAGWILADGLISLVLGGIIMCAITSSDMITAQFTAAFSIFFAIIIGIWLIVSGVGQLTRAFDLHKLGAKGWGWGLFWGIVSILCAVAIFCKPVVTMMGTLSFVIGLVLIVGGCSLVSRCFSRDIED